MTTYRITFIVRDEAVGDMTLAVAGAQEMLGKHVTKYMLTDTFNINDIMVEEVRDGIAVEEI